MPTILRAFLRSRRARGSGAPAAAASVRDLVPYLHVRDVTASTAFYGLLGFEEVATIGGRGQSQWWCYLTSGSAALMLAVATAPIVAEEQAALLYMYSDDVSALQRHLEEAGITSTLSRPTHMPNGELRTCDPDGYVLLIGQQGLVR